jgi:hypothetical protein
MYVNMCVNMYAIYLYAYVYAIYIYCFRRICVPSLMGSRSVVVFFFSPTKSLSKNCNIIQVAWDHHPIIINYL